ncbi:MAG: peptidoglycan glycosyltransferase, partial [Treponema sp.]
MEINSFFKKERLWIAGIGIFIFMGMVIFQYGRIAFAPAKEIVTKTSTSERGSIVDRNGKPLAVQTNFYHFGVTANSLKNLEQFAEAVTPVIDADKAELIEKLESAKELPFIYIKKKITQNTF